MNYELNDMFVMQMDLICDEIETQQKIQSHNENAKNQKIFIKF